MAQKKETAVVYSQEELAPGIFSMWIVTDIADEARPGQLSRSTARTVPDFFRARSVSARQIRMKDAYGSYTGLPVKERMNFPNMFPETRSTSWDLWEMVSRRRAKMYF